MKALSKVYFGSMRMDEVDSKASLPAKLQRMLAGRIDWIKERCNRCGKVCDTGAISIDARTKELTILFHDCRFCRHCVNICPRRALTVRDVDGFRRFQEAMALTTRTILDSFEPSRVLHINILTNISMLCDCWGFSSPSIVPDIGILASQDLVALETASLKTIRHERFIPSTLIGPHKLRSGRHLLQQIHGKDPFVQLKALEKHGVGQSRYKVIEIG